jgi:hypothetical protein
MFTATNPVDWISGRRQHVAQGRSHGRRRWRRLSGADLPPPHVAGRAESDPQRKRRVAATKQKAPDDTGALLIFFNSTRSVPLDFAHARRLHRGSHSIDDGKARTSAPGRGWTGRVGGGGRIEFIPIVCDPDVAGRVNGHVGHHLDAAALENVDDIAGLRARRMSGGVVSGQQHGGTRKYTSKPGRPTNTTVKASVSRSLSARCGSSSPTSAVHS